MVDDIYGQVTTKTDIILYFSESFFILKAAVEFSMRGKSIKSDIHTGNLRFSGHERVMPILSEVYSSGLILGNG